MKTEQIVMCVVALALGMLVANMLTNVCGCKNNVEGYDVARSPAAQNQENQLWSGMGSGACGNPGNAANTDICAPSNWSQSLPAGSRYPSGLGPGLNAPCARRYNTESWMTTIYNECGKPGAPTSLQCVNSAGVVSPDSSGKCPAIPESESDACVRNGLQWDSEALAADGKCAPLQI